MESAGAENRNQPPTARTLLNDQEEGTMSYQQLTLDERYQISTLFRQKFSAAAIARQVGRHRSTITRELARNSITRLCNNDERETYYHALEADRNARRRRIATGIAARKIQGELQLLVESKLRQGWSPEQISGRLMLEVGTYVSPETVYQHVLRDTHEQRGNLRYCLRFGGYKQHRFRKSKHAERSRARKHHIDDRPEAANERRELGHWERDCLLGARGTAALLTMVDRKSRFSRVRLVAKVAVDEVAAATTAALAPLCLVRTLTNDNGVEFKRAAELERELHVPIFFCDPSSPWQRGSVENFNGLLRQFVPKSANLDDFPSWGATALEDTLNHRPRKTLGYRTPHEVWFGTRMELMSPSVRFGLEFSRVT
jgi:IS30 family transposase